ncbi:hypothetical protein M5K25_018815 [Dendrobium thyrsiflorum]|uniref:Uncharacterized protein n=1 Tax=Dendrobium thyrsiflorum TaxID=117978 RepID=A0ABD0UK61_DENTH
MVKGETTTYMKKSTTTKHLQQEHFDDMVEHGAYYGNESGKDSSSTRHSRGARGPMDLYMINPGEDRGQAQMMPAVGTREGRRQVCIDIGRFFFENDILFNVVTSPAYFNMIPPLSYRVLQLEFWASFVLPLGKRKVGNIEDDEDLTFLDTIGDEDASTEDPISDGFHLCTLSGYHDRTVFSVNWSRDGIIATGAADDSICLFHETKDSSVGGQSYSLILKKDKAHDMDVNSVQWNPKEPKILASASDDGSIKLWRLTQVP